MKPRNWPVGMFALKFRQEKVAVSLSVKEIAVKRHVSRNVGAHRFHVAYRLNFRGECGYGL